MAQIIRAVRRALGGSVVACLVLSAGVASAAAPGAFDPAFGGTGIVNAGGNSQLFGVAVQPSGEVVAAGQSGGSVVAERFSTVGALLSTYVGPSGVARGVALQADGKIIVAGGSGGMMVARLTGAGAPETTFGAGGLAHAFGGSAIANAVAVQHDGKIVVAGSVPFADPTGSSTRFALARFNANGSLDSSFGSGGQEVLDFGLPYAAAMGVAVHPDGKIVVVGREQGSTTFAFFNGVVARLNANGSLDGSFAGGGVLSFHRSDGVGSGYDTLNAVTIQGDNKIVIAGADVGGPSAVFLRLNPDGSYDTAFGHAGAAYPSAGTGASVPVGAYGVGIAGGGRIVGAGAMQFNGTDYRAGAWALTPNGTTETTFGAGGTVAAPGGAETCALSIAPDGSLVVAGNTVSATTAGREPCTVSSGQSAFVARYGGYGPPPPGPTTSTTTTTTTTTSSSSGPAGVRPVVMTGSAQRVGDTAATVTGQVNTEGGGTSFHFDYGTSRSYGSHSANRTIVGSSTPDAVIARLTRLRPRTTYHYRLVATNSGGTSYGSDITFRTTPRLSSRLRRVARTVSAGTLVRRGFAVGLTCNQACAANGALLLSASDARRLGLGRHQTTIGSGRASLRRAGAGRLTIRLGRTAATKLARVRGLRLTLRITVSPAGGGSTDRSTKTITLTR